MSSLQLKRVMLSKLLIDPHHHLLYCPIEKVGSSFWKRVFQILKGQGLKGGQGHSAKNTSVFDLSGVHVHQLGGLRSINKVLWKNVSDFLPTVKKFLFVRDPYERLFSGFIDKIFTPTFETRDFVRMVEKSFLRVSKTGFKNRLKRSYKQEGISEDLSRESSGSRSFQAFEHNKHKEIRSLSYQTNVHGENDFHKRRITSGDENGRHLFPTYRTSPKNQRHTHARDIVKDSHENKSPYILNEELNENTLEKNRAPDYYYHEEENSRKSGLRRLLLLDNVAPYARCRLSATFADFVHYVINSANVNEHFRPMRELCPPCLLRYDFLGKMETFKEDAHVIMESSGVNPQSVFSSDVTFDRDSDLNILRDVTTRTFSVIQKYRQCMTQGEMLARIWTTFQIRGFLSINLPFPLTLEDANNIDKNNFIQIVNHAYAQSGPREVRMRQRKSAMMEAFYGLPRSLLKHLESHVKKDCQLFGYECSIEKRFNPKDRPQPIFSIDEFMKEDSGLE